MIESILGAYEISTLYELIILVMSVFTVSLLIAIFGYHKTRDLRLSAIPVFTGVILMALFWLFAYLTNELLGPLTGGYTQSGLFLAYLVSILNSGVYLIEYSREFRNKDFDPDIVNRRHFRSSLNSAVMMVILGVSLGFFSPPLLGRTIMISTLTAIATVGSNHLYIIRMIRDSR